MTGPVLPSPRDEAWRWADLATLSAAAATVRGPAQVADAHWLDIPGARIVFLDGVYQPQASDPQHVVLSSLTLDTAHALGVQASGATGWSIDLSASEIASPVQIVHIATGAENHLPAQITLDEDAVAQVVETHIGTGWTNRLTQIDLERGARLMRAVRLMQDGGFVSIRDEAVVGEAASLVTQYLGAGAMGTRIDATLTLDGDGAFVDYGGALLTRAEQRQECAVTVRHQALNGSSRQTWRAVAAGRSQASLAARVEVARGAQKTDGEQSLRGLLLDRTATVNLKPELEIFADDVKCAHGATVGELDRRALFYLRSRGLPEARARALLTRAFVADALDRIGDNTVRDAFSADAERWLDVAL